MTETTRTCAVAHCDRPYRCSGYCATHYDRMRRTGKLDVNQPVERLCMVENCDRAHNAQGYCRGHYKRYLATGDPQASKPLRALPTAGERDDILSRIMAQTVRTDSGCIQWTGSGLPTGYGTISWRSRPWVVHRAVWTVIVGAIPTDDDWTLDHLCSNRACVNVGHLEVVTRIENSRRSGGLAKAHAKNRARTHCDKGHEYGEDNFYRLGNGGRKCKTCAAEAWAQRSGATNAKRRAQRAST